MNYTIFGKTNLNVSRSAFGVLPLQRVGMDEAIRLLNMAYDGGINFYDTARGYSDSEEKVGNALADKRGKIVIATKTPSTEAEGFWRDLETSLKYLKTDYIDIYQFHNPKEVPLAGSAGYECMLKAKEQGKIRFIGVTAHRLDNAEKALESGLYDTIQFPLSAISSESEINFAKKCGEKNVGFIAMKAMCGGLLPSAAPSMAFLRDMDHVVPIWGFQRESEIKEVLELEQNPPALTGELLSDIEKYRSELAGNFCRGCGYCRPCAAGIEIDWCARMPLLLRRAVWQNFMNDHWKAEMNKINECTNCGMCKPRCPYGLDTPQLLKAALKDYNEFCENAGYK
ncbi:MAG: aldo/keto reductase [Clostridiales bacterium]|jgi:predicted aldo/keto reductase-like oxidoreductase|nr:aldo/keto reductase [Clostridiales bacterium]